MFELVKTNFFTKFTIVILRENFASEKIILLSEI